MLKGIRLMLPREPTNILIPIAMNEPIIKRGLNPQKRKGNTASATGPSDRKAKPADEQAFEKENKVPVGKVFTAKMTTREEAGTQDKNVKRVNDKDAKDPNLDHTIPADYRAKNTPPVEPGKDKSEEDFEEGLE